MQPRVLSFVGWGLVAAASPLSITFCSQVVREGGGGEGGGAPPSATTGIGGAAAGGGEQGALSSSIVSSATGGGCELCSIAAGCTVDELCPASVPLADAIIACACGSKCVAQCNPSVDAGVCGPPSSCYLFQECIDCVKAECPQEWTACHADSHP